MSSPIGWDNRVMLERYIYDYLKKKNCHQTAEIFKQEAGVEIDEKTPLAIDVPDGFLHEWWLTFYDMYGARDRNLNQAEAGQLMDRMRERDWDIFPGQQSMNAQYTLLQGDNSGLTAENTIPLSALGWAPSRENENCLSSESQKELLACGTGLLKPLRSLGNLLPPDRHSSAEEVLKMASMPSVEGIDTLSPGFEDQMLKMFCAMEQGQLELKDSILLKNAKKRKSPPGSEVGSNIIQGATPYPVETSFSVCKASDDIKSMSPADDNDDGASASMYNLQNAIAEVGGNKVKETNNRSSTDGLASGFADSSSAKGVASTSDDPSFILDALAQISKYKAPYLVPWMMFLPTLYPDEVHHILKWEVISFKESFH